MTGKRVFRMAPHPPSLRTGRMGRVEGDLAVPDRRDRVRAVRPHDVETAMTTTPFSVFGKRVVVVGAARSGIAAAQLLARRGAQVTLSDLRPSLPESRELETAGIALELGGHALPTFTAADLIVMSPGRAGASAGDRRGPRRRRDRHRRARTGVAMAGGTDRGDHRHQGQVHHHHAGRPDAGRRRARRAGRRKHRQRAERSGRGVDREHDSRHRSQQLSAREHRHVSSVGRGPAQFLTRPPGSARQRRGVRRGQGPDLREPDRVGLGGAERRRSRVAGDRANRAGAAADGVDGRGPRRTGSASRTATSCAARRVRRCRWCR